MNGLRFARIRISTGPELHYAEQGDVAGDPVVFLHGWPDSWYTYSRVLAAFSPGFRALVPDLRGFGDSERPHAGYAIDNFAADAVAFLDQLGLERASFVGHSFGSFVARRIAITYPQRLARMVLIGTAVSAATPLTREVQEAMRDLDDPVPVEFVREFQAGTAYAPVPEPFFERVVAESLKLPARLWRQVFDGLLAYDDASELSSVTAPTFLVWGEHDPLFEKDEQDRVLAAIPHVRHQVYEAIGHCPNWECPERLAADLQNFMQPGS